MLRKIAIAVLGSLMCFTGLFGATPNIKQAETTPDNKQLGVYATFYNLANQLSSNTRTPTIPIGFIYSPNKSWDFTLGIDHTGGSNKEDKPRTETIATYSLGGTYYFSKKGNVRAGVVLGLSQYQDYIEQPGLDDTQDIINAFSLGGAVRVDNIFDLLFIRGDFTLLSIQDREYSVGNTSDKAQGWTIYNFTTNPALSIAIGAML